MTNALISILDAEEIKHIETDLSSMNLKGLYFDKIIVIDKNIETEAEKTCILAEEIGHYMTSSSNILDQRNLHNQKEEEKARRWAYRELVDPSIFIDAFKAGVSNRWELSQFLELTEDFIEEALIYFKKLYGETTTIDEYIIHFDPLWIYKKFD